MPSLFWCRDVKTRLEAGVEYPSESSDHRVFTLFPVDKADYGTHDGVSQGITIPYGWKLNVASPRFSIFGVSPVAAVMLVAWGAMRSQSLEHYPDGILRE